MRRTVAESASDSGRIGGRRRIEHMQRRQLETLRACARCSGSNCGCTLSSSWLNVETEPWSDSFRWHDNGSGGGLRARRPNPLGFGLARALFGSGPLRIGNSTATAAWMEAVEGQVVS